MNTPPPELPALPVPRARALVLLCNPDAEVEDFAAVVESDPGLTAALLRAANSALSSPVSQIVRTQDAIVRIGVAATRQILSASVMRSEFARLDESGIDSEEMWRHLLVTALLAEELVSDTSMRPVAFTAGLLHDVGRLALASANAVRYEQVVTMARQGADVMETEHRILGTDHATFGGRICEEWRLPEEFVDAVETHHDGEGSPFSLAVVRARSIAWRIGIGDGVIETTTEPLIENDDDADVVERLGGTAGIARMVRWYRDATSARH